MRCGLDELMLPPRLHKLVCSANRLTQLDLSVVPGLTHLDCESNPLARLDLAPLSDLEEVRCGYNDNSHYEDDSSGPAMAELKLGTHKRLRLLDAIVWLYPGTPLGARLETLDVTGLPALEELIIDGCALSSLDVSRNKRLRVLSCDANPITEIDLTHNTALELLSAKGCPLEALDLSRQSNLEHLACGARELTSLSLQGATKLRYLTCNDASLEQLDLTTLDGLQSLTLRKCSKLPELSLQDLANTAVPGLVRS